MEQDEAEPVDVDARVLRFDMSPVGSTREGPSGGLIVRGNLRRTGVLDYRLPDGSTRRELCHPDEVFSPESRASFLGAPVTEGHPGKVSPANWGDHACGHVLTTPTQDGKYLATDLHIPHGPTVKKIKSGALKEISSGYECSLDPTPGEYNGEKYDAIQRNVRANHVALGPSGWGRAGSNVALKMDGGPECGVADLESEIVPTTFDGMTDEDKSRLAKLEADIKARDAELEKLRVDAKAATSAAEKADAQGKELETLRAQNALLGLQAKRVDSARAEEESQARQDAKVEELVSLREDARRVFATAKDPAGSKWKADAKSADDIRREVFNHLEPNYKADTGIDPATISGETLSALYRHVIVTNKRTDAARAGMLSTTIPRSDAKTPAADDDDDAPAMDAAKARKDMVKFNASRFQSAADRKAADAKRDGKGGR